MYEYKAVILNVVDGDTFDLDIDLGFNVHTLERVRLLDIDCPEKNARKGEKEKIVGLWITEWAKKEFLGREVMIKSWKGTDSFGRYLVDLFIEWDDGYTNVVDTYNAKGFNKLRKDYSLDRLLEKINGERAVSVHN